MASLVTAQPHLATSGLDLLRDEGGAICLVSHLLQVLDALIFLVHSQVLLVQHVPTVAALDKQEWTLNEGSSSEHSTSDHHYMH